MGSKALKTEKTMSLEALPGFFREFAGQLENALGQGDVTRGEGLAGFGRIKIRVKKTGTQAAVKVKVKKDVLEAEKGGVAKEPTPSKGGTASASAKPKKPSYKKLKKRMDKTFASFSESFKNGVIPLVGDVETFYQDAEQMVSYADKGEPYYQDFMMACAGFLDACRKADLLVAQAGHRRLEELKTVCHDRFK